MQPLRHYQTDVVNKIIDCHCSIPRPYATPVRDLVVMPTASGKSHVIAHIATYLQQFGSVAILTPTRELALQNRLKLQNNTKNIQVLTIQKAYYRDLEVDALIIDECHLVGEWGIMYQTLLAAHKYVLGFTATPYRLDCGHLIPKIFKRLVIEIPRDDLCKKGFLTQRKFVDIPTDLLINVKSENFHSLRGISRDSCPYTQGIIAHFLRINSSPERTLVYGCDLIHCKKVQKAFASAGKENVPILSGKTPKKQRDTIITDFKANKIAILINCQLLTTGFDYPDLQNLLILRPTRSYSLYQQILGRGDRTAPGKDVINIYDYTLNYFNFEPLHKGSPLRYCLYCQQKTDYRRSRCTHCNRWLIKGEAPTKKCIHCQKSNAISATYCIYCGQFMRKNVQAIEYSDCTVKYNTLIFKRTGEHVIIPFESTKQARESATSVPKKGVLFYIQTPTRACEAILIK